MGTRGGFGFAGLLGRQAGSVLGSFASVGDSRLAQMYSDPSTQLTKNALHFFNQANARLAQSMIDVYNGAVSGQRPDQYVSALPSALASTANFVLFWSAINGILAPTPQTADQLWFGWTAGSGPSGASSTFVGFKSMLDQTIATGKRPIFLSECGSSSTFGDSTKTGFINQLNAYALAYCQANPRALYFDTNTVLLDNPTAPTQFKSGYVADGTHTVTLGAYYLGKAFQSFITPYIRMFDYSIHSISNPNLLPNPLFTNQSGGSVNSPATGTAPSGLSVFADAGATCAVSTAARADGRGYDCVFTCTFSAAAQRITARFSLTPGAPVAGDIHKAMCELSVDAGSSNFAGAYLQELMQVNSTNTQAYDCFLDNTFGPGPAEQYTQSLMTKQITAPSGITTWQFNVRGYSTAAGAATFRLGLCALQKLN